MLISFYLLFLFLRLAGFLVFAQPFLLLVFPVAFLHLVRGNHVVRYMLDLGFRGTFHYFYIVALVYLCEGQEGRKKILVRASLIIFFFDMFDW